MEIEDDEISDKNENQMELDDFIEDDLSYEEFHP